MPSNPAQPGDPPSRSGSPALPEAEDFGSTRLTKCGLLPLAQAGVEVSNKLHATCTVVKVKAADRADLLRDIASFFQSKKHSIVEADVTTSAHDQMACDIFLVQQSDGGKIAKPRQFAEDIRDVVLERIRVAADRVASPEKPRPEKDHEKTPTGESRTSAADEDPSAAASSPPVPVVPEVRKHVSADVAGGAYQVDLGDQASIDRSRRDSAGGASGGGGLTRSGSGVARGDGLKLENSRFDSDSHVTEITMEVPDRVGLIADVMHCLHRNDVGVVSAHVYTTADGLASNYFCVRDNKTMGRVDDEVLEEMREALAARCHFKPGGRARRAASFKRPKDDAGPGADAEKTAGSGGVSEDPGGAHSPTTSPHSPHSPPAPRASARLVSEYNMPVPERAGMSRLHGGEVLESNPAREFEDLARRGSLSERFLHLNLNALPPAGSSLSPADLATVDAALNRMPAYASLLFQSAKEEIAGELREVRWRPGEVAFQKDVAVPNLYVVMEGALRRDPYVDPMGKPRPPKLIPPGALFGTVAVAHAYKSASEVRSANGENEGVATRAYAINGETFKRIVRSRVHRARQLCTNVLNIVETFRFVPAEYKELLLNALWSDSKIHARGAVVAGGVAPRAAHIILEGEVRRERITIDGGQQKPSGAASAGQEEPKSQNPETSRQQNVNKSLAPLRAGESFGERWLASDEARGAAPRNPESGFAYVAARRTVTLVITRDTLRRLWGEGFDGILARASSRAGPGPGPGPEGGAGAARGELGEPGTKPWDSASLGLGAEHKSSSWSSMVHPNWPATPTERGPASGRVSRAGLLATGDAGADWIAGAPDDARASKSSPSKPPLESSGLADASASVHGGGAGLKPPPPMSAGDGVRRAGDDAGASVLPSEEAKKKQRSSFMASFKSFSKRIKRAMGAPSKKEKAAREERRKRELLERQESSAESIGTRRSSSEKSTESASVAEVTEKAAAEAEASAERREGADVVGDLVGGFSNAKNPGLRRAPSIDDFGRGGMKHVAGEGCAFGEPPADLALSSGGSPTGAAGAGTGGRSPGTFTPARPTSPASRSLALSKSPPRSQSSADFRALAEAGAPRTPTGPGAESASLMRPGKSSAGSATSRAYAATPEAMGMTREEFDEAQRRGSFDAARNSFEKPGEPSPLDRLVFAKQLGVGLTGSVYKAWRRRDPTPTTPGGGPATPERVEGEVVVDASERTTSSHVAVAVKVMDKAKILDINETVHVVQESRIMRAVSRHPFIISMLDAFQTPSAMFIVMEYAAGRDLFHMIHERGALGLFQTRAFVTQVVLALDHVHAKGFVYRDLKPENLLVRHDGYLRLTDFGFAKALQPGERAYTVCGTPDYLAPETLRQQGCNRAADFWAVGVLLFEMMTGYPPFHGETHSELYRRITAGRMRSFPRTFDESAADLCQRLLRQSEGERIGVGAEGIQRIRRHAFFKGFSWTAILEQRVQMHRPEVKPDPDRGPEDIPEPIRPECVDQKCTLTADEQTLFAAF